MLHKTAPAARTRLNRGAGCARLQSLAILVMLPVPGIKEVMEAACKGRYWAHKKLVLPY